MPHERVDPLNFRRKRLERRTCLSFILKSKSQWYVYKSITLLKVVDFNVDQEAFLLCRHGGASYFLSLLPPPKPDIGLNVSLSGGKKKRTSRIAAAFNNPSK